jgi:hypothetical protein
MNGKSKEILARKADTWKMVYGAINLAAKPCLSIYLRYKKQTKQNRGNGGCEIL